MFGNVFFAVN